MLKKALLTTLLACTLAGFGAEAFAKTLRYAEFGPNRGTRAEALTWFADELKKRSNGNLEIEFHWGGSLIGTSAVLSGLRDGVADMGSVIGFFTPKELRGYNIGDLPMENSDEWIGMRALYELATGNEQLKKEFDDNGIAYVSNYTTGPIQLICTKEIKALDDLKGLKLRGSGPYGKALTDLGADVQRMSQGDVYQALDSGLVECNQNYYYSMKAYKQYEVAPHVTELNWGANMSFGIFMNKAAYDDLSDGEKEILANVGSDLIDHLAKLMIESREADKKAMLDGIDDKQISVTMLPAPERAKLLAAGKKYVDLWVSEATEGGYDGDALLAAYGELISKYAAERESKGYPWTR